MLREDLGRLTASLFQRYENSFVQQTASIAKHVGIGDLVRERVLERVFLLRKDPRLVNELARLQSCESFARCRIGRLGDVRQQRSRKLLPDHGRRLKQPLVVRVQPVDATGEEGLRGW